MAESVVYCDYLRHFGVEDEIVACLPAPRFPGRIPKLTTLQTGNRPRSRERAPV